MTVSSQSSLLDPIPSSRKERLLLWLWKVLPLPQRVRRAYIEFTHPRFLVGVMALIEDDQGRILIGEHTYRTTYRWGLPGGYLQHREEPAEGLKREVAEETGLTVDVGEILQVGLHTHYQIDFLFRARVRSGQLRRTVEVSSWTFVPKTDLLHILPNQLVMLQRAGIVREKGLGSISDSATVTRQSAQANDDEGNASNR